VIHETSITKYPTPNILEVSSGTPKETKVWEKGFLKIKKAAVNVYTIVGPTAEIEPCFKEDKNDVLEHWSCVDNKEMMVPDTIVTPNTAKPESPRSV